MIKNKFIFFFFLFIGVVTTLSNCGGKEPDIPKEIVDKEDDKPNNNKTPPEQEKKPDKPNETPPEQEKEPESSEDKKETPLKKPELPKAPPPTAEQIKKQQMLDEKQKVLATIQFYQQQVNTFKSKVAISNKEKDEKDVLYVKIETLERLLNQAKKEAFLNPETILLIESVKNELSN